VAATDPMRTAADMSPLLTYEDVATILRLSARSVRRMATRGDFEVVHVGPRSPRIRPESVAAFIDAHSSPVISAR
jgi:hypothetical protein